MQVIDTLEGRRLLIHTEFSALSDFIWKTPRLIEDERTRESKKLHAYFPDEGDVERRQRNSDLRKLRAYFEGVKLELHFPEFMAKSNLFMAASAFEYYLLGLCEDVQDSTGLKFADASGQGVSKFFKYLKTAGHNPAGVELYEQIDALLTLRNALLHAFGMLELSREAAKVSSIVKSLKYIEPSRRKNGGLVDECGRPEALIVENRLRVTNNLSFRASAYFCTFLLALGARIQATKGAIA